ncbi:unnamed protein product [Coffea canephora]|uniref:Uncharacterized protein n=1 Tax=Coffea canephora TaxID=49390 RepID=A0A068VDZ9_COFCA|nr:unnamed protein product [Coffea canephora]
MKDDWVTAALLDDSVVAELLSRLKQSSSSSSSSFFCEPPKPLSLPFGWGHRQPRSKPTATKKDSTTNTAPTTTRCSPTTPLSWSGGAASPSDGAYDDCSTRPLLSTSSSSSDPSRSKGAFAIDAANVYSSNNKKSKKKRTFAELKEEEDLLLKERATLTRELASLHVTLEEQKARSENLKRFKIDLNLQTSGEMCGTTGGGDRQVVDPPIKCSQMEVSTCDDAHHPSMPRFAVQDGFVSSGSSRRAETGVDLQESCFVLPDLNVTPAEEEFGPEVLHAIQLKEKSKFPSMF